MPVWFLSDVHVSAGRPEGVAALTGFLAGPARRADRVYVLGDLFDVWLGDDDHRAPHPEVVDALGALSRAGVPVAVMHGNHDFLLGDDFRRTAGCTLLDDPAVVEVHGTRVLLSHGDALCTDDRDYQAFRARTRDPEVQRRFLALPLAERVAEAERLRIASREASALKPAEIMDVNAGAVREAMRAHGVRHLVHGHTHRPAIHEFDLDGAPGVRIVLGDWYEQDSALVWDASGYHLGRVAEVDPGTAG